MFRLKKQPKIKMISIGVSGQLIFTIGLGRDGKVYNWDALYKKWVIQEIKEPGETQSAV